jgi:hypothetical protein
VGASEKPPMVYSFSIGGPLTVGGDAGMGHHPAPASPTGDTKIVASNKKAASARAAERNSTCFS